MTVPLLQDCVYVCVHVCVCVSSYLSEALIDHKVILSLVIGRYVCQNHMFYYRTELISVLK